MFTFLLWTFGQMLPMLESAKERLIAERLLSPPVDMMASSGDALLLT